MQAIAAFRQTDAEFARRAERGQDCEGLPCKSPPSIIAGEDRLEIS
jgi:hypothetical protein